MRDAIRKVLKKLRAGPGMTTPSFTSVMGGNSECTLGFEEETVFALKLKPTGVFAGVIIHSDELDDGLKAAKSCEDALRKVLGGKGAPSLDLKTDEWVYDPGYGET